MNHAQIAAEALRYRLATVKGPIVEDRPRNIDAMAAASVTAAEPEVDSAIRQIATVWVRSGLAADDLTRPWNDPGIDLLFAERPDLVDLLDDIVRAATRVPAA